MKSVMKFIVALFVVSQLHAQVPATQLMIAAAFDPLEVVAAEISDKINTAIWIDKEGCYKTAMDFVGNVKFLQEFFDTDMEIGNALQRKHISDLLYNNGGRKAEELLGAKGYKDCQSPTLDLKVAQKAPKAKNSRSRG